MAKSFALPNSKGEVAAKWLRGPAGPSVEDAKKEMFSSGQAPKEIKLEEAQAAVEAAQRHEAEVVPSRGQGGNVPNESPKDSALRKIRTLRSPVGQKMTIDLPKAVEEGFLTLEEANALAAMSGQKLMEEPVEAAVEETKVEEVPPTPPPVAAVPEPEERLVQQEKHFRAEIYKDGREWVVELTYDNGSGPERFTAPTKDEALLKVAVAKGHGTLKVRDEVRKRKLGLKSDGWDFFWKQVFELNGISQEEFNTMSEKVRVTAVETMQREQMIAFKEIYGNEYYRSDKNWQMLQDYINERQWPITMHNLELAFHDLTEEELLETRPKEIPQAPKPAVEVPAQVVAAVVEDSTPARVPAAAASASATATTAQSTGRKRGSMTGLIPGQSSATPSGVSSETESGTTQREPSLQELRKMPLKDLAGLAKQGRKYGIVR